MHLSDKNRLAVLRNIRKVRQVWGRLGKLLRREGADPFVLEIFYLAVVQAVLIFWAETWVLMAAMPKTLESVHVGFLSQVVGKKT